MRKTAKILADILHLITAIVCLIGVLSVIPGCLLVIAGYYIAQGADRLDNDSWEE